ncbi:MAG: hypothetical protein KGJ35_02790 [Patescibacteria group bacterium]|nr:hypothetical protein [Patescibacteria group bacterium]
MKTTPRDFFMHLGATIALYVSAIALMNLGFAVVNKALPDTLAPYFSVSSIIWPVSLLIVLVPILYVIEWTLIRDITKMPEKRDLWIRRWRIYLTLFLTGATIAGDLIALINTYLNGEVTERFIWKVVIVFVVSAVVFVYYLLMRNRSSSRWTTVLAWIGLVLALAAIVGGFIIVGSPAKQRAIRFDQQRITDLQNLQSQIISYWQNNGKLPATTSLASIIQYGSIVDPDTKKPYQYQSTTTNSFELCADFALPSSEENQAGVYNMPVVPAGATSNYDWTHPAGNYCFARTVDSKLYPLNPKPASR